MPDFDPEAPIPIERLLERITELAMLAIEAGEEHMAEPILAAMAYCLERLEDPADA
jgi:hypothetical protein